MQLPLTVFLTRSEPSLCSTWERTWRKGRPATSIANYAKVLSKGFKAIRQEAQDRMSAMEGRVFGDDARKYTFYKAVTVVCDAAMILAKRYAALCREKAGIAAEPRKSELLKMAGILDWIMENPCRTFHEAVQAINTYQLLLDLDGNMHGLTIGRLDQHLGRYLRPTLRRDAPQWTKPRK